MGASSEEESEEDRSRTRAAEEELSTGWEPEVPATDTVVRRYTLDWADFTERLGATRNTSLRDDHVAAGDLASSNFFLNCAILLHPRAALDVEVAVARVQRHFDARDGGPFLLVSPWPTVDLRPHGFTLVGHPPIMLRPAGGEVSPMPDGLEIRPVTAPDELRAFEATEARAYPVEPFTYPDEILALEGWRMWIGLLDDRPVATAAASLRHDITRVEWISTLSEVRGRGIGAAMTRVATLLDPTRDAVLISSDLGRPVYERMGYRALERFTLWQGTRKRSAAG